MIRGNGLIQVQKEEMTEIEGWRLGCKCCTTCRNEWMKRGRERNTVCSRGIMAGLLLVSTTVSCAVALLPATVVCSGGGVMYAGNFTVSTRH